MRRMITNKQAETLDNVVYNPQTNTTEVNGDLKVGGYLYVDGAAHMTDLTTPDDADTIHIDANVGITSDLRVDGNIISGLPADVNSVFGYRIDEGGPQISIYSKEQLIDIALKYNHNGFLYYTDIGKLIYLDPNAQYVESDIESSKIFIIQSVIFVGYDYENANFGINGEVNVGWGIVAYYSGENEITLQFTEY